MSQDNRKNQTPRRQMFDYEAGKHTYRAPVNSQARQGSAYSSAARHSSARPVSSGNVVYSRSSYPVRPASQRPSYATAGGGSSARGRRRSGKKMRNTLVAFILIVAILVVGIFAVYSILNRQIGGEFTAAGTTPDDVKQLPEQYAEYTDKKILHLLVCGIDYNNDEADGYVDPMDKNGNTDMILYVVYDTVNNKVTMAQFPRDIYVGNQVNAGIECKINGLYPHSADPTNRIAPLAQVFKDQFGLPVDYYITVDMDAVKEIIDIVVQAKGGLPVYVPIDVDYTNEKTGEYSVMQAGWRYFTGEEAEYFLRNRHSSTYKQQGDIMRLQMQQSFYSAIFREFKSLSPSDLLPWMRVLLYRVKTDMDPLQLGALAQKALAITGSDITFVRPAVSGAVIYVGESQRKVSLLSLVPEDAADLFNQYLRPEGYSMSLSELDIQSLPVDEGIGISPASIRTIADVQAEEPPLPA